MKQTNRTSLYAVPILDGSACGRIWYNIGSYVGQPYDVLNIRGYNCATLVAAVLRNLGNVPIRGIETVQGLTGSSYLVRVGNYNGGY